jgi:hypothetical protein
MTYARVNDLTDRIEDAITELQAMIRARYPEATFDVAPGEDPDGTYIWTTVATDDPDLVLDCVVDRLLALQIDEGIAVHVIPIRAPERVRVSPAVPVSGHRS